MKTIIYKIMKVTFGLFLFAAGIVMTINANLGLAPWDVFHDGLTNVFGITLGQANIVMGFIIIILDVSLGQEVGWATIMNMILIGSFVDILMFNNLIPTFTGLIPGLIMIVLGLLLQGYGCWIYVSAGWGAGPRDGLMVGLTKKTSKSVRVVKSFIEVIVTIVGYLLGGSLGVGTLIMALIGGQVFQFAFKTVNFSINEVEFRFIKDDIMLLKEKINSYKNNKHNNPS